MNKIKYLLVLLIFFGFTQLRAQLIIHSFALNACIGGMVGKLGTYSSQNWCPGYLYNLGASYTINKTFCLRLNYQKSIYIYSHGSESITYNSGYGNYTYNIDIPKLPNGTVGSFRFDMLMGWFGSTSHIVPYFLLGGGYNSISYDEYQSVQNDSSNYSLANHLTSNNWGNFDLGFGLIYRIPPRMGISLETQINLFLPNDEVGFMIPLKLGIIYSF